MPRMGGAAGSITVDRELSVHKFLWYSNNERLIVSNKISN